MKKEPDEAVEAELMRLEEELQLQAKLYGRVDPDLRRIYEELRQEYAWGENLSEDD